MQKINVKLYHKNDKSFQSTIQKVIGEGFDLAIIVLPDKNILEALKDVLKSVQEKDIHYTYIYANSGFFSSIKEFAYETMSDLLSVVAVTLQVELILLNNIPDVVIRNIKSQKNVFSLGDVQDKASRMTEANFKTIKRSLSEKIIGQDVAKKRLLLTLGKRIYSQNNHPLVIGLIGPQGVGKTEMAKTLASSMGHGEIFREQMSMLNDSNSVEYLFGGSSQKSTFAKKLQQRSSNIILLDEINLLPKGMLAAFYQFFDEGKFVDTAYTVYVKNAIIICTGNYLSKTDMAQKIGFPLFSRFSSICSFEQLTPDDYSEIASSKVNDKLNEISPKFRRDINSKKIVSELKNNPMKFPDVRNLDHYIDDLFTEQILKGRGLL